MGLVACALFMGRVALLAEGVDRNDDVNTQVGNIAQVALLAEGVDRNSPSTSAWA